MAKTNRRFNFQEADEYNGRFMRDQTNRSNRLRVRQTLRNFNVDSDESYVEDS